MGLGEPPKCSIDRVTPMLNQVRPRFLDSLREPTLNPVHRYLGLTMGG